MSADARENLGRIAREHWVSDNSIVVFFQKFVSKTPQELREVLDEPYFNAGFVAGLNYARTQNSSEPIKKGDLALLSKVIETVIEATKHTPFISKN